VQDLPSTGTFQIAWDNWNISFEQLILTFGPRQWWSLMMEPSTMHTFCFMLMIACAFNTMML